MPKFALVLPVLPFFFLFCFFGQKVLFACRAFYSCKVFAYRASSRHIIMFLSSSRFGDPHILQTHISILIHFKLDAAKFHQPKTCVFGGFFFRQIQESIENMTINLCFWWFFSSNTRKHRKHDY